MTSETGPEGRSEVVVCGGHPEVRLAMVAALLARGLPARSCETTDARALIGPWTAVLVVVLNRAADEVELIAGAAGSSSLRVVAVHGPTDVRGREAARRAGADVLLPRSGRTAPLVEAVLAAMTGAVADPATAGLPDQPQPDEARSVRSPR